MYNAITLTDCLLAVWLDANSKAAHFRLSQGKCSMTEGASPRSSVEEPQEPPWGGKGRRQRAIALHPLSRATPLRSALMLGFL
jgi:hypothetical protein